MTASYDTFAGQRITALSLQVPYVGLWTADVTLAGSPTLPLTGTLVHGNMSLSGAVYRSAAFAGITTALLVGGFGGWSRYLVARGYSLPFGVTLSTVLIDAASEVGEEITVLADRQLGAAWTRPAIQAGKFLRQTAGANWWVNGSGSVVVGPRMTGTITSAFQIEEWDGAAGIMTVASEDPASWQPGMSFAGPTVTPVQTIAAVRHTSDNDGRSRMRVMVT